MGTYRVWVIGGWCGNRMFMVAEHLAQKLADAGFPCSMRTFNAWENYTQPPAADLILQLLPAFSEAETGCPVLNIKPLLADLDDSNTMRRVLEQVRAAYPV